MFRNKNKPANLKDEAKESTSASTNKNSKVKLNDK
jgi:hypothetical protein